jgi:uncharacterized SAM-binding protein YcdF (DUF218 family)
MAAIADLFEGFVFPPGVIFIAIVLALWLLHRDRARAGRIVLGAAAAVLLLGSLEPVADLLLSPLESRTSHVSVAPPPSAPSHIVALGGGLNTTARNALLAEQAGHGANAAQSRGTLAPASLTRAVHAYHVHRHTDLPVILSGGSPLAGGPGEADLAARHLRGMGLSANEVLIESESRSTWQNAAFVAEKFAPQSVILVTSAYHMPRAMLAFRSHGITALPAPTDYRVDPKGYTLSSFLPSAHALRDVSIALHEYVGLLYYRLR